VADSLIAGIVPVCGGSPLTRNERHFDRVAPRGWTRLRTGSSLKPVKTF
jgi:hypothetical protein